MTEKNFSYESFFHSIYLGAPIDEVYKLIASSGGLEKWFMGKAVYTSGNGTQRAADETAGKADTFSWHWLEKGLDITGTVLEAVNNERFSFTFGSRFDVTITIKENNSRTLVTLAQNYNKEAEHNDFAHINCCVCWGFFLVNLKSVMEFGNDLRETLVDDESLVNR